MTDTSQQTTPTISTADVIDDRLDPDVVGVRWLDTSWTECRGHLGDLSWKAAVVRSDEATGVAQYGDVSCDACREQAAEEAAEAADRGPRVTTATEATYTLRTLVNDVQEWSDETLIVGKDYSEGDDLSTVAHKCAEYAATNTSWAEDAADVLTIETWIIPGPIYPGERHAEPVADGILRYDVRTGRIID